MSYDFAVVGGDRRFFYLAQFLKNKKFKVIGFNLFNFENEKFLIKIQRYGKMKYQKIVRGRYNE